MKNLFTNLMKNTAKRTQNTGGGASQSQTSRSEGARQITARFESAQMKNTSLISACSAVDVPMPSYGASDEHPMSIRSASDERRWNSRGWKYVACILMVLFMGVGNVWGTEYTLINQSTGAINSTDFVVLQESTSAADRTIDGSSFAKYIALGSNTDTVGNYNLNRFVRYDVKTNSVTIDVYAHNTEGKNSRNLYISYIEEGATKATKYTYPVAAGSGVHATKTFTPSTNASISVHVSNTKLQIVQFTASESGTALKVPGEVGYTYSFNKPRNSFPSSSTQLIDNGMTVYNVSSNVNCLAGSGYVQLTGSSTAHGYIKFTTSAACQLNVKCNNTATYYVGTSSTTSDNSTSSKDANFDLSASTTYYILTGTSGLQVQSITFNAVDDDCKATANAGADKETTVDVGVAMAATAASSGFTGAWSIKSGSPSTATSQLGTTSSNTMTFTPNTYGTYTLVWTVTDDSDGSCSASDEATVTVPAPTHAISYTNTKGAANSNPATYSEGTGIASFAKLRHVVGYDFTGWSPSSISSSATTDQTIDAQWTARAAATGTDTLTYALAFSSGTITTSSITRVNGALYDATDVSLDHTSFNDNTNKTGCSGKLTTTTAKGGYVEVTFKIADGYTFTPTEVRVQGIAVTTNKTIEVELTDNADTPNSKSVSGTLTAVKSPETGGYTVTLDFDESGEVALEGTVTAKIFAYGATDHWRMGTPFVITGTLASAGPSVSSFTPASGSKLKTGATVTIAGSDGSTVYYQWSSSSSAPTAAAVVSSGTAAGTSGVGTVTTTGIASSATYLYAVAVKDAVNSNVASASYTIDDTAPTFVSSVPANSATGVTASGNIVLTFSEDIATVDATQFTLTNATKGAVSIDGSDARKVNIAYSDAAASTTVTLATAAGAVTDAAGNTSAALSSISFTTAATPVLTAISADRLYQAAEMANITFTEADLNFTGLSTNNLFKVYGDATGATKTAAKGKNENHDVTDDISEKNFTSALYILSNSNTNSTSDPTEGAIEIITPSTAGLLYLYLDANNSSLTLKKKGTSTSTSLSGATYKAMEVDANTHYFINGSSSGKRGLYGIQYVSTYGVSFTGCSNVTPSGDANAIKGKAYTATFTASTSYTLPAVVAVTIGGETATVTTDYTWSVSDGTGTLTIPGAKVTGAIAIDVDGESVPTYTIKYNKGTGEGITGSHSNDSKTGGEALNLPDIVFSRTGQTQIGWATSDGGDLVYDLGASYTSDAAADLYPVWADNCYSFAPSATSGDISADAEVNTSSGGSMVYTPASGEGSPTLTYTANGIEFGGNSQCQVTVTLQNKMQAGTIIMLEYYIATASDRGFYIANSDGTNKKTISQSVVGTYKTTYKVESGDGLINTKSFIIKRYNKAYLKSVTVANCAPITYDLTVAVNNGEYGRVSPASVTDIPSGTMTSSSENTFTVNGTTVTATPTDNTAAYTYAFSSWSGLPATVTENATVTANFTRTPVSYTLAWNTNGGSDLAGSPTSGATAFGTTLTKPNEPTKSNYTFAGWNTANDGSGTNYTGAMTMPAADATYYAQWTQAVTLDANTANHGSGANQSATAVWNATGLTGFVATAAATDYAVIGYFTDATGGTQILNADGTFAAEDISGYVTGGKWSRTDAAPTLYAQLQQSIQVTYDGNGDDGTGSVPNDATDYKEGDVVTVLGNTGSLAKASKVFNGWNTAADGTGTFYPVGSTLIMPDGDVTLYAVWNSTTETTYYYSQAKITNGALVQGLNSASVQFFTKINDVVANSTAISFSSTLGTGSIYYFSNDLSDAALSTSSSWSSSSGDGKYLRGLKFENAKTYTLVLGTKVASSIKFYGWSGSASGKLTIGGVEYTANATKNTFEAHEFTKSGGFTGNVSIVCAADFYGILVITAYTLDDVYDVTFDANTTADVSGMPEEIVNVPTGSKISEPLAVPTRTGYTFDRWCTDKEGESAFYFSTGTITAATTLYAKWTPIDYNVNYVTPTNGSYTISVAGGAAGSADKIANYEQTITLVATPASTSYAFSRWTIKKASDDTDITNAVSLSGQATATFTMPAYSVTVEAAFEDAYALTYNANGVEAENMPETEHHPASAITLSSTEPTADDCVFLGWSTATNGSADDYTYIAAGGDFTMPAEAETLYAQWGPKVTTPAAAESLGLATGRVATLQVEATTCSGSLSYQWYKGEDLIGGATSTQYTIPANEIAVGDSYAYTCRVSTDAYHYTTSPAITVKGVSECGWEELALITATGGSTATATKDGETISDGSASALISNLSTDGSAWKLGGGNNASWFGVHLESGFQVGDSVIMKIKTNDIYVADGEAAAVVAGAANVKVALSANKSSARVYESDSLPKSTDNLYLRIVVTQAMIDAGLTTDLMFYRTQKGTNSGLYQNHSVYTMQVKRYNCPGTNESKAAGNWNNPAVWSTGVVPTINDRVYIDRELTVNTTAAKAKEVVIMDGGKLIVAANQALIVTGTITNAEGNPTTAAELKVASSSAGNGTLIFENDGNAATVQMYSKAEAPKNNRTWKWQYAAAPAAVSALYNYYGGYLYKWNDGWNSVSGSDNMELFAGYCVSYPTAGHTFEIEGELAATGSVDLTIPAGKEWVVGNSWTAPIQIKQMEITDFVNVTPTIYLFNTGMDNEAEGVVAGSDNPAAGSYVTIPIANAGKGGLPAVISSLQGFYVANSTGSSGTLKLDYAKHVRPTGTNTPVNGPMLAPKRMDTEKGKEVMTVTAAGSRYTSKLVLIAHEDYTFGYDPGHDGENINEAGVGPLIYTLREDGTHDDVSAIPEYEGAVVGFVAGEDSEYTFRFTYDGADIWYLNDTKLGQSTLISNENTYTFTVTGDDATRFVISKTSYNAPSVTTGVGNQVPSTKARKLMIDGILYIIREGRIYTAEGALVK